jgi:hypothetical protein
VTLDRLLVRQQPVERAIGRRQSSWPSH